MKSLKRKTKRLEIRPFTLSDYKAWKNCHLALAKARNKWDVGPRTEKDLTEAKFKKVVQGQIERRKKDSFYDLGVFDHQGNLVGGVSLMEVTRMISQSAYLGYRIFNNHWGKGYAEESIRAIVDIGFKDLKLHRIEAGIEPTNKRSIRVAKKLKMRREGVKRRMLYLRKQWVDAVMYTLTTEDLGMKYNTANLKFKARF